MKMHLFCANGTAGASDMGGFAKTEIMVMTHVLDEREQAKVRAVQEGRHGVTFGFFACLFV